MGWDGIGWGGSHLKRNPSSIKVLMSSLSATVTSAEGLTRNLSLLGSGPDWNEVNFPLTP